eukprot:8181495-Alexandrium_andersonii.AAC.1
MQYDVSSGSGGCCQWLPSGAQVRVGHRVGVSRLLVVAAAMGHGRPWDAMAAPAVEGIAASTTATCRARCRNDLRIEGRRHAV